VVMNTKKPDSSKESFLRDGPVTMGPCSACGKFCTHDIYRWHGVIVCGDCRYEMRHGKPPSHERGIGNHHTTEPESERQYRGGHFGDGTW
jgi:hypothetical protein